MKKELKEGQLCWFSDYPNQVDNEKSKWRVLDVFVKVNMKANNFDRVYEGSISLYNYCRPLTKAEIRNFMELAE